MEPLKSLIQILEDMLNIHSQLLEYAKEKRTVLIDGNIQGLQELIQHESVCVEGIQTLEQQRMEIVKQYMNDKGLKGNSPFTLEELLQIPEVVTSNFKSQLTAITIPLRTIIKEINQINDSNQQLIQTSLSYVHYSIGMLMPKEPSIGYGPQSKNRYASLLDAKI